MDSKVFVFLLGVWGGGGGKIFRIQETSKWVNPSKPPFRKFDPKPILSLLIR